MKGMVQVAGPAYKVLDRNHPSAADMLYTFWTRIDRSQFLFLFRTPEISHSKTGMKCVHAILPPCQLNAQQQYLVKILI